MDLSEKEILAIRSLLTEHYQGCVMDEDIYKVAEKHEISKPSDLLHKCKLLGIC
jgi:hypothetical protein